MRITATVAAALAAALALGGASSASAGAVKIAGVEVPADCALAKNEHPRLLFTKADLPRIRKNCEGPLADDFSKWKASLDAQIAKGIQGDGGFLPVSLGVMYQVTGDRKYADAARPLLAKCNDYWVRPHAYDLVFDALTPDEVQSVGKTLLEGIKTGTHGSKVYNDTVKALALCGASVDDEYIRGGLPDLFAKMKNDPHSERREWFAGSRGGCDDEGLCYIANHGASFVFPAYHAWETATGMELFKSSGYAKYMAAYYVYHFAPNQPGTVNFATNNCCGDMLSNLTDPSSYSGMQWMARIASVNRDGLAQWWAKTAYERSGPEAFWSKIALYDTELPAAPPEKFPVSRLFQPEGIAVMRSDWTSGATYAHFHCGPLKLGRSGADNLSFIIHRKGNLAVDTGTKWPSSAFSKESGLHHQHYFCATVAHNTLLLWKKDMPQPEGLDRDAWEGGQVKFPPQSWCDHYGIKGERTPRRSGGVWPWDGGEMAAYETNPVFDYVAGDATRSYGPERAKLVARQFVYLRPDTFVVFDRVVMTDPEIEVHWLLHSLDKPANSGELRPDISLHPEGHFTADGDTWTITDSYSYPPEIKRAQMFPFRDFDLDGIPRKMGGKLFGRTLLPKKFEMRLVGGPGHEFEAITGVNYDPGELAWKGWNANPHYNRICTVGQAGWRIEVLPAEKSAEQVLLHVLHACDLDTPAMPKAELVERGGAVGAKVTLGAKTYEILFARQGPLAGHIKATDGGKTVLDRDLAARVEDNFKGWKDDPRHKEWVTNPHMRAVIGESEAGAGAGAAVNGKRTKESSTREGESQ